MPYIYRFCVTWFEQIRPIPTNMPQIIWKMMTQILVKANARSKKGDILEPYQALLQHHNVSWFLESIYIFCI